MMAQVYSLKKKRPKYNPQFCKVIKIIRKICMLKFKPLFNHLISKRKKKETTQFY